MVCLKLGDRRFYAGQATSLAKGQGGLEMGQDFRPLRLRDIPAIQDRPD